MTKDYLIAISMHIDNTSTKLDKEQLRDLIYEITRDKLECYEIRIVIEED